MYLKNKTMGNVLRAFLLVGVLISGALVITTYFYCYAYPTFEKIMILDQALSVLNLITWCLLIIFYLIWIYQVHKDIQNLTPYYDIRPGGALARIMIPFYNLYGLWHVYSTMGSYFQRYSALEKLGKRLAILTPIYFFLYWGSRTMERLINKSVIFNDTFIFSYYVVDFIFMVSIFIMANTIIKAFRIIEADYETYVVEDKEPPKWAQE